MSKLKCCLAALLFSLNSFAETGSGFNKAIDINTDEAGVHGLSGNLTNDDINRTINYRQTIISHKCYLSQYSANGTKKVTEIKNLSVLVSPNSFINIIVSGLKQTTYVMKVNCSVRVGVTADRSLAFLDYYGFVELNSMYYGHDDPDYSGNASNNIIRFRQTLNSVSYKNKILQSTLIADQYNEINSHNYDKINYVYGFNMNLKKPTETLCGKSAILDYNMEYTTALSEKNRKDLGSVPLIFKFGKSLKSRTNLKVAAEFCLGNN